MMKNYICLSQTILFANKFMSVINQITLKKIEGLICKW